MSRHRKDPLRPLTADERQELSRLSGSPSAPAAHVEDGHDEIVARVANGDDATVYPFESHAGTVGKGSVGSAPSYPRDATR